MATGESANTASPQKGHSKKAQRLMTLFGASLVLLTFLIKDFYRDRAKDASDSADSTLAEFAVHRQIFDSYVRMAYVQEANDERLQAIQSFLQQHFTQNPAISTGVNSNVVPALNRYMLATDYAKLVGRSLNSVEPKYADSLNAFIDKSDKDFSKITRPDNKKNIITTKEGIEDLRGQLESKTSALVDEMDKDLSESKEKAEKHYQLISKWSVVTYIVGWAAALIGQWLGIKGLSAE
jgi:hypothetical protein